jgi:glycerol-1-phosphate dehydrogenase [NAD(P)+]
MDSEMIIRTLENVSAPTTAKEIKVNEEQLLDALRIAQSLRPDRYTILTKVKMDNDSARNLAKSVNVI